MGATTGTVNEAKFGRELQVVIEKITEMAPDIIVSASADGTHITAHLLRPYSPFASKHT